MTVKKFFNRASWIILVVLFLPAGVAQASKSAAPGDKMYPVKLVLEDAILLMMKPSNLATSDMEMKFTKRRLLEVEQVTDTPFIVKSLKSLNEQVVDTTVAIGKVKNLEKQSKLVDEYIQTLQETQVSLDQQKVAVTNSAMTNPTNNHTYTTNQVVNNNYYTSISQNNEETRAEIQRQIEETKLEIAAEIERLKQVALENEQIRQQQQAEAAAIEAEKQRQAEAAEAAQAAQERQQQEAAEAAQAAQERQQQEAAEAAAEAEAQQQQTHDNGNSWRKNSWGNRNNDHDD